MAKNPKIVTIGGGTGHFMLLRAIKSLSPDITAIVNMSDDGGSSGVLRDELGVLPPGDVRQCLVALSASAEMRDFFSYRFKDGSLKNQSLGNIVLSGLELKYGSFEKAIEIASSILRINGKVVPITLEAHTLLLHDGAKIIRGEKIIDNYVVANKNSVKIEQDPATNINPAAEIAIAEADFIVIAPGSLYGSILSVLTTKGAGRAIERSRAKKIFISNLVTKYGQTDDWHVVDYVHAIESLIGVNKLDYIIYNNQTPPPDLLEKYLVDGGNLVDCTPDRFEGLDAKLIAVPLVDLSIIRVGQDGLLPHSFIRHDRTKVKQVLSDIVVGS